MKTLIPWFILLFLAYVLQSAFFNVISYNGITVDLILLITIFLSILYDKYAILYGFCSGLFLDLASGSFLGIHTFTFLILCILINRLAQFIYKENIFLPLVASLVATILNDFMIAVLIFLLGYDYNIWQVFNNIIVTLIYNLIFTYPVYFVVVKVNDKLQAFIKSQEF
ncbi:rod shape-determining protein MreD [Megamonas hypermegale]|uniref:Rod shape-determining protein MreD n=1 Tax=Megamonas hypermegale TaxID=158847 RepID=A0A921L774_9FIRM|nr:rod shape-determining protein MreD [Megamonas hypermegale]MDM8142223.1 rod shape-determining protein MreD [Megamonas hypermegale]HJF84207.1 rod shape-determining protein MreD [Megamonas hypermegale]